MATPRRRLVRPAPATPTPGGRQPRQTQRLRACLERERAAFARWLTRLRRAFRAVDKQLQRIARIERKLSRQEGP
jgi:hypothetical protein